MKTKTEKTPAGGISPIEGPSPVPLKGEASDSSAQEVPLKGDLEGPHLPASGYTIGRLKHRFFEPEKP